MATILIFILNLYIERYDKLSFIWSHFHNKTNNIQTLQNL